MLWPAQKKYTQNCRRLRLQVYDCMTVNILLYRQRQTHWVFACTIFEIWIESWWASADLAQLWHSHWSLLEICMFALIIVYFMWFSKSILYFIQLGSVVSFFRLAKCIHMHWSYRIEEEIHRRNEVNEEDSKTKSEKEKNYVAVLSFNGSGGT